MFFSCCTTWSTLTLHIAFLVSLVVVSAWSNCPPWGTRREGLISTISKTKQEARNFDKMGYSSLPLNSVADSQTP